MHGKSVFVDDTETSDVFFLRQLILLSKRSIYHSLLYTLSHFSLLLLLFTRSLSLAQTLPNSIMLS